MDVRLASLSERLRNSLFFIPMAYVVAAVLLGALAVELDQRVVAGTAELPFGLSSTVDSARAILGTIASATITFAGIAFSISLLVIQLASSQYSPRVVHGLLRDPFTKQIMGVVIGTFTYCLVVLRAVRGPLEDDGTPVIPSISVGFALLFGVVSILAIVAFINHSAHSMDVSRILARASEDGIAVAKDLWGDDPKTGSDPEQLPEAPPDHLLVTHGSDGWVRDIDFTSLAASAPPGGTVRVETEVGRYAIAGTPLCRIWPQPDDEDEACRRARKAIITGDSRTVEQDVGYAVRQLADVALRALSPGINDPTTAQDSIFHLGSVLRELLSRHPPRLATPMDEDRLLLRPELLGHRELVAVAFDEVRLAAVGMPTVCIYLLEVLHLLEEAVDDDGPVRDALRRQAALIRAGVDHADLGAHDADRVRDAHDRRFGPPAERIS
ncbi:MAG TPA: DUF2254 domain-containing protein [Acidimicrobiales bacterium]|nr:DUF2254 domain-containing protein [Acidimicrobiales bacterium]